MAKTFNMIENYIYLYHIDKYILLPTYPQQIQDSLSASFQMSSPLSRSAPIFSYSHSGPRTIQVSLNLHRELMTQINYGMSNMDLSLFTGEDAEGAKIDFGDDYVDVLVKQIQAIALPRYAAEGKMVNPPMVALRFGNDIFIKGVVNGGVSITYSGPLLEDNKYALVDISFTISEVDPYDAESVTRYGSFRGLNTTLERRLYKK